MRRFFFANLPTASSFELPEEESKHMVRVLRMDIGDELILVNGKGTNYIVKITIAHPKRCAVEVLEKQIIPPNPTPFHLAIAPTKNSDRMEWLVEKIVEVGATRLSFIQCDHSERQQLKLDRLERVAISAMKQAEHDFLLQIDELQSLDDFIAKFPTGLIAHCAEGEKSALKNNSIHSPILIGPEGDFSSREIALALQSGYKAIHLGTSRLRTETAGLVATVLAISNLSNEK